MKALGKFRQKEINYRGMGDQRQKRVNAVSAEGTTCIKKCPGSVRGYSKPPKGELIRRFSIPAH